jgi:hypothetical protein
MRSRGTSLIGFFFMTLTLAASGCGGGLAKAVDDGGANDSRAAVDGAASGDAVRSDASSPDSGTDAGSSVDASAAPDASVEGGTSMACNTLANTAKPVTVEQLAEGPPSPLGGTVDDGIYVLTSVAVYTGPLGPSGPSGTAQTTIVITGSTVEIANRGEPPTRTTTLSLSGTTFTSTDTCPDNVIATGSFTATSTTLAIFLDGGSDDAGARTVIETFTKE